MSSRWFRISFARSAFERMLVERGLAFGSLSVMHGIRAMVLFSEGYRPQHAERDELLVEWQPREEAFEFSIVRRMQRHDNPESTLRLCFGYSHNPDRTESGSVPLRSWRDVKELNGYQVVRGSRPRYRRLTQS